MSFGRYYKLIGYLAANPVMGIPGFWALNSFGDGR